MTTNILASTAANRLRFVVPNGMTARGRSVPYLT